MITLRRALVLTDDLLRRYSRRGNFHSEPGTAAALGFAGLVAQGMQVAGPAYGLLLDAWGEEFLAHGHLEVTFVSVVHGGDTVEAVVDLGLHGTDARDDEATITVRVGDDRTAVVGRARRREPG